MALLLVIMLRFGVEKKSIICYKEEMVPSDEMDIIQPKYYYLLSEANYKALMPMAVNPTAPAIIKFFSCETSIDHDA